MGFKAPLLFSAFIFPFIFPFRLRDLADEGIHPVCTVLLHLRRHMAVDIRGERCGVVPQVTLYGLDIVSSPQGSHRVTVSQIMKPCSRHANVAGNPLEVVVDCTGRQMFPYRIAEHIALIMPQFSHQPPHLLLLRFLLAKQINHEMADFQGTAFSVLGGDQAV